MRWTTARRLTTALGLVLAMAGVSRAQVPLNKRAPAKDLALYVQFDGLDAHEAAWKASAEYKVLNETTLGVVVEDLARQLIDLANQKSGRAQPTAGETIIKQLKLVAKGGFALAINGKILDKPRVTLTLRGLGKPESLAVVQSVFQGENAPGWTVTAIRTRWVNFTGKVKADAPKDGLMALIRDKGDLILCMGPDVEATMDVFDGKVPDVSTHPIVAELAKAEGTFKPVGFGFLDPKGFGPLPPDALAMGLGGVNRFDLRWGFDGDATVTILRLLAPSPRSGVLALFDGAKFDKGSIFPIPAGTKAFAVASISPSQVAEKLAALMKQIDPAGAQRMAAAIKEEETDLKVDLRADFLNHLGPRMTVYAAPGAVGGLPVNAVAVADIAQPEGFATALGKVIDMVNIAFKGPVPLGALPTEIRKFESSGTVAAYSLFIPDDMVGQGPLALLKPTLLIGSKAIAIGTTSLTAREGLDAAEGRSPAWKPEDEEFVKAVDHLPPGLVAMAMGDPRQTLPVVFSSLPGLIQSANAMAAQQMAARGQAQQEPAIPINLDPEKLPDPAAMASRLFPATTALSGDAQGIRLTTRESIPGLSSPVVPILGLAMLIPARQASMEVAKRMGCTNNMKMMGLAMANYESANNRYPAYAIADADGKPLLSWRVAILPYIEQVELYNKFKLDEPWDSEHNKPLLKEMPKIYACPDLVNADPTTTHYRVWIGDDTMFPGVQGRPVAGVTDGTSNTLLVAESDEGVPWTKPEGMEFNLQMIQDKDEAAKKPLFGAGSPHPGGFNATFCDGSVRFLKKTINRRILNALITPASGEVINADAY